MSRRTKNFYSYIPVLILCILLIQGCSKKEIQSETPPVNVQYFIVSTKDIPVKQNWIGQTRGSEDVEIRARVEGYIDGEFFTEGSYVSKGALIYTIDAKELEQKLIEAKSKLSAANTMMVQAKNDVNRYAPLAEAGAISQQLYENAIAIYEARIADVEAAQANVGLAEINFNYSRVTAPISGIIGISQYNLGDYVSKTAGTVLNTISNVNPIKVRFSISEQEYLEFRRKAEMKNRRTINADVNMILSDGTMYDQTGTVNVANRQVDPSTGTLMLEASFSNPNNLLRPGQYSKIVGVTEIVLKALVIPTRAIMELQGQYQVYVVGAENKAELKTVKKGNQLGQLTEVVSGLSEGEKVITEGFLKVKPGMIVNPVEMQITPDATKSNGN